MLRKSRKSVGILGLGIIGQRAATALRTAGFKVSVWNRTPMPMPHFLSSPAEVADVSEVLQLFVADAQAVMEVLTAAAPKLRPEHIVLCSATIGPKATLEVQKFVEDHGAQFLDCPFTGSKLAAERAQLVYYVGGEEETYLKVKPVLEATSKAIVRTGGVGDAALLKVVTNQIAAVSIQALAEGLAMVKKAGMPAEALVAVLEHNACRSGTMDLKLPKMIEGDYEPHFSLKHMFKDVQLGIDMAESMDLETPVTAVTAGLLFGAMRRGWGEQDFSALYQMYEEPPTPRLTAPGSTEAPAPAPILPLGNATPAEASTTA